MDTGIGLNGAESLFLPQKYPTTTLSDAQGHDEIGSYEDVTVSWQCRGQNMPIKTLPAACQAGQ